MSDRLGHARSSKCGAEVLTSAVFTHLIYSLCLVGGRSWPLRAPALAGIRIRIHAKGTLFSHAPAQERILRLVLGVKSMKGFISFHQANLLGYIGYILLDKQKQRLATC